MASMTSRSPSLGIGLAICLLVVTTISVLFTYNHVSNSGSAGALCMPGLSIRCEPDDCGNLYVRCGTNQQRQEVPANKVCYKGALISVHSKMHSSGLLPHNCRERTSYARNSTIEFDLKACNCPLLCSGTAVCVCYCKSGPASPRTCSNNGRTYANSDQAKCCLPSCKLKTGAELEVSSLWTEALDFARVVISSSLKQTCNSLRSIFTFPRTMEADACCTRVTGKCNEC